MVRLTPQFSRYRSTINLSCKSMYYFPLKKSYLLAAAATIHTHFPHSFVHLRRIQCVPLASYFHFSLFLGFPSIFLLVIHRHLSFT